MPPNHYSYCTILFYDLWVIYSSKNTNHIAPCWFVICRWHMLWSTNHIVPHCFVIHLWHMPKGTNVIYHIGLWFVGDICPKEIPWFMIVWWHMHKTLNIPYPILVCDLFGIIAPKHLPYILYHTSLWSISDILPKSTYHFGQYLIFAIHSI